MTIAEQEHKDRVAALGCIVCRRLNFGFSPAQVHHIREGQGRKRASDFETIPLCPLHHQGAVGIHHMGTKAWAREFWSESELLQDTLTSLNLRLVRGYKGVVVGVASL